MPPTKSGGRCKCGKTRWPFHDIQMTKIWIGSGPPLRKYLRYLQDMSKLREFSWGCKLLVEPFCRPPHIDYIKCGQNFIRSPSTFFPKWHGQIQPWHNMANGKIDLNPPECLTRQDKLSRLERIHPSIKCLQPCKN